MQPTLSSLLVVVELARSRDGKVRILQVQASNAPRTLDVRSAPFLWLGSARNDESSALLREIQASAAGEPRGVLLSLLGLHAREDSGGCVTALFEERAITSKDMDEVEGALTGLSFLPRIEAKECLARIAARARQPQARDRAREMLVELESGSAKDFR